MKRLLFILLFLLCISSQSSAQTGMLFSAGALARTDVTANTSIEMGVFAHIDGMYFYGAYGSERNAYLKIGAGGKVGKRINGDYCILFYTNAGRYGPLPKHFGASTSFYLRRDFSPYLRITITTFDPAIEVGLRYQLFFVN